ncbi:hypothetical protein ONZ45_g1240 [Pleurotus djamor]|nr:hypothetical protein ONZ45_g12841 [Pleurotus djamor]KAJ8522167.1 hypothetical protein ONZ45_g1240 [Pleurotus djamor]
MAGADFPDLYAAAHTFPAIDNHAHPLLQESQRNSVAFEALISEAQDEAAPDAVHTVACLRATHQLQALYGIEGDDLSWEELKAARAQMDYTELCDKCFKPTGIQCILIDDGLGGTDRSEPYPWHDRFTSCPTKRVVRIEVVAEEILKEVITPHLSTDHLEVTPILDAFKTRISQRLTAYASDPNVVGFKSVVCYRTGLDVSTFSPVASMKFSLLDIFKMYKDEGRIRLAHKALNDFVVRTALEVSTMHRKPVQFHTGLGDNDMALINASPAKMQPIIRAYPDAVIVLLHASYPFTREAGYLTAVYANVFLDFGEVFPFVSGPGQRILIQQILELCPTNKIMWSTDGHWFPESYYLGTIQARQALYAAISDIVKAGEITEAQGVQIIQNALFHNANRIYELQLQPNV